MKCTCPPIDDVFSPHIQIGTRDPCPIHPEPDLSKIDFKPAINDFRISMKPFPLDERQ